MANSRKEKVNEEVEAQVEEAESSDTPVDEEALRANVEANTATGDSEAPEENVQLDPAEVDLARNTEGATVDAKTGVKFPTDPGVDNTGTEGTRNAERDLVDPELLAPDQAPHLASDVADGLEDEVAARDPRIQQYLAKGYTLSDLELVTDTDGTLLSVELA